MCQDITLPKYSCPYSHIVSRVYCGDTPTKLLPIFWHSPTNTPSLVLWHSFQSQLLASSLLVNWCKGISDLKNMSMTLDYRPIYWKMQPNLLKTLQCHIMISYNGGLHVFILVPWFSEHTLSTTIHSLNDFIDIIWGMNWMYQF